ncbi:MAG TPA: hypothetical protein EYP08_01525 [Pyrodictiaceae archaeon]|nr:hypothetical protein [Pyrodictiaceae archaeon]
MDIVYFKGVVESLTRELIPKIYLAKIKDDKGKYIVEMDLHEELFIVPEGARVEFSISKEVPNYRDGVDFLGRATFVSRRKVNDHNQYLFSIGGLLVVVTTKEELDIKPIEKVYIKLAQIE